MLLPIIATRGGHVLGHGAYGFKKLRRELAEIHVVAPEAREEVRPRGLGHADGAGYGGGRLFRRGAGDAHLLLNRVDGLHDVGIGLDGEIGGLALLGAELVGVRDEALHLLLSAAVPELQVVEHREVLLGEALVGVLHALHVGAHLVDVVRHVDHGHVGVLRRLGGVSAHRLHE